MKVEELPAIELRRLCLAMSSEELIKAIILLYVSDWDVIILFAPLMTKGQVLDLRVLYDRLLQQKVFFFLARDVCESGTGGQHLADGHSIKWKLHQSSNKVFHSCYIMRGYAIFTYNVL